MCKTRAITYKCKHTFDFRLSTCRGTFTTQAKPHKDPKAACSSNASLTFRSKKKCGNCQLSKAEKDLEKSIPDPKTTSTWDSWELHEAQADHDEELWALKKRFPDKRYAKLARPERGRPATQLRGSMLRQEVMPEEVVERWSSVQVVVGTGWGDWDAGDYPSLADEIAEREAETNECLTQDLSADTVDDCQILDDAEGVDEDLVTAMNDTEPQLVSSTVKMVLELEDKVSELTRAPALLEPPKQNHQTALIRTKTSFESKKTDIELFERLRCFSYAIAVSS